MPDIPAPIGEKLGDLFRGRGFFMEDSVKKKCTDAHNPATASVFRAAEKNTAFLYKYQVDPDASEIEFPEVRKQFFDAIKDIPGKARHQAFHIAVIGRAP